MTILLAILIFGLLIFVHELGHFLAARSCGVTVLEFAIGMGPKIVGYRSKKSGTIYSLRLFPIGGYCSMEGENDPIANDTSKKEEEKKDVPLLDNFFISKKKEPDVTHSFSKQSALKRFWITVAGPMMNVILGFILMLVYVLAVGQGGTGSTVVGGFYVEYQGETTETLQTGDWIYTLDDRYVASLSGVISYLEESEDDTHTVTVYHTDGTEETFDTELTADFVKANFITSLSEQAGLRLNDQILKINDTKIHTYVELSYELMMQGYEPVTLTVLRDGEETSFTVQFPTMEESGVLLGNMDFRVFSIDEWNVKTVLSETFYGGVNCIKTVFDSLAGLISGRYGAEAVSGPVGITKTISEVASVSMISVLYLVVMISINLGIMNLLPLPALDGGRIFLCLVEIVTKKRFPEKIEGIVNFVGLVVFLILAVLIALKDIMAL